MLDIVFSDSALSSLKLAQSYGKGNYLGGAIGVMVRHEDGTPATSEEIENAKREAEERERRAWETAVPLNGSPDDCFGFSLAFSHGAIPDGEDFWDNRRRVLSRLYSIYPDDWQVTEELWLQGKTTTDVLFRRAGEGEPLRAALGREWQESKGFSLRAVVSGRLCGVGEDFYDWLLLRELEKQPTEFQQARLIGTVLGKYQLGLSDSWLALRMGEMIARGMLEIVTPPPADGPVYHRTLRKSPGAR